MSIEAYDSAPNGAAPYQPTQHAPAVRPRTVHRLTEWAESAMAAHQVAESLVRTSFAPEAFRNKPHEATAAILAGDEVGLSPMASLRAFDIINGTAAPRAITQRAVVQSKGHDIWLVESTEVRAVVRGQRVGSSKIQESVWTIDRARKLKLTGKPNWQNQAPAMLVARATSECSRLVASDALMGIPYSAEELWDGVDVNDLPATLAAQDPPESPAPARRTAQRRTQPRSAPATDPAPETPQDAEPSGPPLPGEDNYEDPSAPSLAVEPPAPPEPAAPADSASTVSKQMRKLFAVLGDGDVHDKTFRLRIASDVLKKEITSYNQLTSADMSVLIDTLEPLAQQGPLAEVFGGDSQ